MSVWERDCVIDIPLYLKSVFQTSDYRKTYGTISNICAFQYFSMSDEECVSCAHVKHLRFVTICLKSFMHVYMKIQISTHIYAERWCSAHFSLQSIQASMWKACFHIYDYSYLTSTVTKHFSSCRAINGVVCFEHLKTLMNQHWLKWGLLTDSTLKSVVFYNLLVIAFS